MKKRNATQQKIRLTLNIEGGSFFCPLSCYMADNPAKLQHENFGAKQGMHNIGEL